MHAAHTPSPSKMPIIDHKVPPRAEITATAATDLPDENVNAQRECKCQTRP
jgi:hypothetical protein